MSVRPLNALTAKVIMLLFTVTEVYRPMTLTDAVNYNFHSLARNPGYISPAPTGSSSHTDGALMVCLHLICIQKCLRLLPLSQQTTASELQVPEITAGVLFTLYISDTQDVQFAYLPKAVFLIVICI